MPGDNAIVADDCAIHNCRINSNQAIIAKVAAMQRSMMGNGTIVPNNRGGCCANMDHHEILNIGSRADFDEKHF